jgi:hypothetical protein
MCSLSYLAIYKNNISRVISKDIITSPCTSLYIPYAMYVPSYDKYFHWIGHMLLICITTLCRIFSIHIFYWYVLLHFVVYYQSTYFIDMCYYTLSYFLNPHILLICVTTLCRILSIHIFYWYVLLHFVVYYQSTYFIDMCYYTLSYIINPHIFTFKASFVLW